MEVKISYMDLYVSLNYSPFAPNSQPIINLCTLFMFQNLGELNDRNMRIVEERLEGIQLKVEMLEILLGHSSIHM